LPGTEILKYPHRKPLGSGNLKFKNVQEDNKKQRKNKTKQQNNKTKKKQKK